VLNVLRLCPWPRLTLASNLVAAAELDALAALALAATNAPLAGVTSAEAHAPSGAALNGAAVVPAFDAATPGSQRRVAPSNKVDGVAMPEFPPSDHPAYRARLQALLSVDNAASPVFWDSPTINTVVGLVRPRHADGAPPTAPPATAAAATPADGTTPVKPDPDDAVVASPDGSARRSRAGRVIRPPPAFANMTTDLDLALAAHEAGDDYLAGSTGGKRRRSSADLAHAELSGRRNSTGRAAASGKTVTVGTEPSNVQRLRTWSGALVPVWTAWPPQTSVQVRRCSRRR